MTPDRFKQLRVHLWRELSALHAHYEIFQQLYDRTEKEAEVQKRYLSFFHYTIEGHRNLTFLQVSKVTERNKKSVTIWKLIDALLENPELSPHATRDQLEAAKSGLLRHSDVLKRIWDHRGKRVAHLDEKPSNVTVSKGEMDIIVSSIKDAFHLASSAHDRCGFSLQVQNPYAAINLLADLNDLWTRREREWPNL